MLRKFEISIDGKKYLVEMEEIEEDSRLVDLPLDATKEKELEKKESQKVEPIDKPVSQPSFAENAIELIAPMPGTVLQILINIGDQVVENQPLLILEAMKMENEIVANATGTITGIQMKKGDVVNPGDVLLTIG